MITQFIVAIPEGKSHADFIRKPTVALTIQEVMLLLSLLTNPYFSFNQLLFTSQPCSKVCPKTKARKDGEIDPKFWEILLSGDKKDYEHICEESGVTDFLWMLKKQNEMKGRERRRFVRSISSLKHTDVNLDGSASFELDLNLLDSSSRIFIFKNQVVVEEVNVNQEHFLIVPMVDFLVKLKDVKAMEMEDTIFECVLSKPLPKIMWVGKKKLLEKGDKYDISVSEDKLIHRLLVKDCMLVDKGIYVAVDGIKSSNVWLIVEVDTNIDTKGKKKQHRKQPKPEGQALNWQRSLQNFSPPQGYQLYMTCAVRCFPTLHDVLYFNDICFNSKNNYISYSIHCKQHYTTGIREILVN
uniref:Uncharacterized protein n=1 Tax=Cyprinus carpio TaxID=7962 RepID=A0A8C2K9G1_CYPCA